MKKHNQTKKAKEEFLKTSTIALFMRGDSKKVFTREDLSQIFQMNDRSIRAKVAEIANYLPVISLSDSKGYRILCFNEETSMEDMVDMLNDAQHQICELQSRVDNLKARMKPLIAFTKVLQSKIDKKYEEEDL